MRKRWEIRNKDTEPIFLKTKKKKLCKANI